MRRYTDPEARAVMIAAHLEPLVEYPGAMVSWPCTCLRCGREVAPTFTQVRARGNGCAYCARTKVDPDEAVALMRRAGYEPLTPYANALARWPCRCMKCGRISEPRYNVVQQGSSCPYCAGKKVDPEEAVAAMRAANLEPTAPYPGALRKWPCRCTLCDRAVAPLYAQIQQGQRGCPYCAGKKVDPETARVRMLAAGVEPIGPYPGATKPWPSTCLTCGRAVRPTWNSVQQGRQLACKFCVSHGIDLTSPGVVYLLSHDAFFALKIGVTTTAPRVSRIKLHEAHGWRLEATWDTATGETALAVEAAILRWWRDDLGAPIALTKEQVQTGGYTETASRVHVDLERTKQRVRSELNRHDPV